MMLRRPLIGLAVTALAGTGVLLGCADDASPGEQAVCDQIQAMVTQLETDESSAALQSFFALDALTADSGNQTMATQGEAFFELMGTQVDDYEELTVEQTSQFADAALERGAAHLGALGDECDRIGETIEVQDPAALTPRWQE